MDEFQKSLLRLMTTNLTESERIRLIGQLQFAIVLLQKQQQQFEENKDERDHRSTEHNSKLIGFNENQQGGDQMYEEQGQKIQCLNQSKDQDDHVEQQPQELHQELQRKFHIQENETHSLIRSTVGQQHDSKKQFTQQLQQSLNHVIHQPVEQQHVSCRAPECDSVLSVPTSVVSEDHNIDLQVKLRMQTKEVQKHDGNTLIRKNQHSIHTDRSRPPQEILQRDEDTSSFTYFQTDASRHQSFPGNEINTNDPAFNFDQNVDRWTTHKVEVQLHESTVTSAGGSQMDTEPFCPSEIEVVRLTSSKECSKFDPHGSVAMTVSSETIEPSTVKVTNCPGSSNLEDGDNNTNLRSSRDQRILMPPLYTSDPTLSSFSVSPRDAEDDPLLAPITLETEDIPLRSDHISEAEMGDQNSDVCPQVESSEFPTLRVSLPSKRKARKPRRMTPQEDVDDDDLVSPYHICPVCNLVWRRTNDYVCHLISHSPSPVTCAHCKGTFENTALLRSHECFDSNQSLFFRRLCGYCGTGFVNKKAFNRHKRTTHAFVTSIGCNVCPRTFYDNKSFYGHLESNHVAKGWRACRKCGHISENEVEFRHHTRISHSRSAVSNDASNGVLINENFDSSRSETELTETSGVVKTNRLRRLPFKCNYCSKRSGADGSSSTNGAIAFATRTELHKHVTNVHHIRCDDCGKTYRTSASLQKHRNICHGFEKRRRIDMTLSPLASPKDGIAAAIELAHQVLDDEDMNGHNDIIDTDEADEDEDGVVERVYEESIGPRGPVRNTLAVRRKENKRLTTHKNSKSTNQRRAARSRARARRQCQQQLNGYKCRFCTTRFHTYSVYREHLQLNHLDQVRTTECRDCQQVFLSQSSLEKHRLTRTHRQRAGEEKLERHHLCELCGKNYLRLQALQRHMKTHINDYEFCCPHCDFKAVEKSNLKAHLSRHFGIKPFACDKCDAKFTSRRSLKDHFKFKHSDSRDFFCEICGMGFKTLGTLSRHKKGHSTEKPYVCYCGVQFNRLSNLRRHLKSVHQTDDSVLPVKRLKKFTNNVDTIQVVAPPQQQPELQSQQLTSLHMSTPSSSPPASVMHNLHTLSVTQPTHHHHSQVEVARTPELPETDEDSTHAVLHSFLNSNTDSPHISAPTSMPSNPSDVLVHQTTSSNGSLYCNQTVPETTPSSCIVVPPSSITVSSVAQTACSHTTTGPMLRSLVGIGDPGSQDDFNQTVGAGSVSGSGLSGSSHHLRSSDQIWRPMGSVNDNCNSGTTACTIVSSVNCVLDSNASSSNVLPFDDVLWSSAVLPQTVANNNCIGNNNSSITYLLSGTGGSQVSLVGQSDVGSMLFNSSTGVGTSSNGIDLSGPTTSSNGELTSTLMISHMTGDPLGLNSLTGSLVSPTLGTTTSTKTATTGILTTGNSSNISQLQVTDDEQQALHSQHNSHQQQSTSIQQHQQPSQPTGHQCSDFSVCYLIGRQNNVK